MSDNTTTAEAETEVVAKPVKVKKVVPSVKASLEANGRNIPVIVTEHAKGPARGQELILLDLPLDNEVAWNNIRDFVGAENFYRKIFVEAIRDICNDASAAARGTDGKVDDTAYLHEIEQGFLPASRASGPSKKELEQERGVLVTEIGPYFKSFMDKSITDEEKLVMAQLLSKLEDLNTKIEHKLRKTKAPAPVEAAA
jgi:hypothetical protein